MNTNAIFSRLVVARIRASKVARLLAEPRLWPIAMPGLLRGVFPSLEHAPVRFGQFATVFDVGSSRGQFALFALWKFPGAKVVCFEPLPRARAAALKVLRRRDVEVHAVALGATPGETEFHVSQHDDSSSLLPIGTAQVTAFPGTQESHRMVVPVDVLARYIDDSIRRPSLLKIDVQGLELEVLRGAGASLSRVDAVFVEASFVELYTGQALAGEVVGYLVERGFELVDVHGLVRAGDGTALQADLFFHREQATGTPQSSRPTQSRRHRQIHKS